MMMKTEQRNVYLDSLNLKTATYLRRHSALRVDLMARLGPSPEVVIQLKTTTLSVSQIHSGSANSAETSRS